MSCRPPAARSPTPRKCHSIILHSGPVTAELPRSEEITMPPLPYHSRSVCCLESSSQTRGTGPADTFEKRGPSLHTELHPEPTDWRPRAITQPPTELQAQVPSAGVPSSSPWPCARCPPPGQSLPSMGPGAIPCDWSWGPCFLPTVRPAFRSQGVQSFTIHLFFHSTNIYKALTLRERLTDMNSACVVPQLSLVLKGR